MQFWGYLTVLMYQVAIFSIKKKLVWTELRISENLTSKGQRSRSPHEQLFAKTQFLSHNSIKIHQAATFVNPPKTYWGIVKLFWKILGSKMTTWLNITKTQTLKAKDWNLHTKKTVSGRPMFWPGHIQLPAGGGIPWMLQCQVLSCLVVTEKSLSSMCLHIIQFTGQGGTWKSLNLWRIPSCLRSRPQDQNLGRTPSCPRARRSRQMYL